MTTKAWWESHSDVIVEMNCNHLDMSLDVTMIDTANKENTVSRRMPFRTLPLSHSEIELDDYLCAVFEQLYRNIKVKRNECK